MPLIERQGITLVGVALGNLENDDAIQLALPLEGHRARALDLTIDTVRDRFGSDAITRAVLRRPRPRHLGAAAAGLRSGRQRGA